MINDGERRYVPISWFEPVLSPWDDLQLGASNNFLPFNHLSALTTYLLSSTEGDTNCEIAGGGASTIRVMIRLHDRRITTRPTLT